MKNLMACLLVVTMSGCPDVQVDPDEVGGGPTVEFDPARSQATKARFIPFPNDLARDPTTGKVNLGEQNCETPASKFTRENVLNKLDGFGTYQTAMQVSFTAPVDEASLAGNIVLYQLTDQGMPIMPSAATQPIPITVVRVGTTPRFAVAGKCDPQADAEQVNAVTFVPSVPLKQKSTYFVALLKGITSGGKEFAPSYTWGLVSSPQTPVTLDDSGVILSDRTPLDPADEGQRAQLIALAGMWKLHSAGLQFLDAVISRPRTDILVGFQFTTQTVTDPLDPAVTNSPANKLPTVGILQTMTATGKFGPFADINCGAEATTAPTQCFLKLALGGCSPLTTGCTGANYMAGSQACALTDCAAIADVLGGGVLNVNYQTQNPNMFDPMKPIQGAWSDPVNPEQQASITLETLIVMPVGNPPMNNGWPVVVFGHGLGSSKESALAIAGHLARQGFATVAIDTAAHGSRAVRISKDPALGCIGHCFDNGVDTGAECDTVGQCTGAGTLSCGNLAPVSGPTRLPPSPTTAAQCYAPFLSSDLGAMRDGIRQTVLDHQRVIKAIKACGESGCAGVSFDPTKIHYLGMSLGGILGTISAATSPDIDTAVINVGGVGWADILENTETLAIRCQLVNGLIDAGILVGDKWNGSDVGLCLSEAWKMQPGWATFSAIGRWVLDPADGANFTSRLAMKHLLIQEVVGDAVVPNIATERLAALTGVTPLTGDPFNGAPSAAITEMPTANKLVKYVTDAMNVFVHSSLLRPATTTAPGINGTRRLVTDAITYLLSNNQ